MILQLFPDFPRVNVGPYNPLSIEEGDTAAMLCEVTEIVGDVCMMQQSVCDKITYNKL